MKSILIIAKIIDLVISLFIHVYAVYLVISGMYFAACIVFGMAGLWQIPIVLQHKKA